MVSSRMYFGATRFFELLAPMSNSKEGGQEHRAQETAVRVNASMAGQPWQGGEDAGGFRIRHKEDDAQRRVSELERI